VLATPARARVIPEQEVVVSDIQNLEARIAVLEALAAKAVGGGGGGGSAQAAGGGYQSPGQWIAGTIASGLPPGGPTGQPGGPGAQAAGEVTGTSTCWCESRFVCATMKCGGSGWC
jgi:hypothetical protein